MGFGFFDTKPLPQSERRGSTAISVDLLHRAECNACPLNDLHNKIKPSGSKLPDVYMLGSVPIDDRTGRPFGRVYSRTLGVRIPDKWTDRLRWNNVVRTPIPQKRDKKGKLVDREPTEVEIECCRPSIERDIVATEPLAIFGFGALPLQWALDETGIKKWCGRKVPVNIAGYSVWFFPMLHPQMVHDAQRFKPRTADGYGSDIEFGFALDLKRAFRAITAGLPTPVVHTPAMARRGIEVVSGMNGDEDLERIERWLEDAAEYEGVTGADYETNKLRPYNSDAKILTMSVSTADGTLAWPWEHREARWSPEQLDRLYRAWQRFMRRAKSIKAVHNLAFEHEWTAEFCDRYALREGRWGCTQSQAYLLDERQNTHSLDFQVMHYFGLQFKSMSNLNRKDMESEPLRDILPYNGLDAKYHRLLYLEQAPLIRANGLQAVYEHHMRRIPATVLTQRKGIPIDQEVVQDFEDELLDDIADAEEELMADPAVVKFEKKFGTFNPGSSPDVMKLFNQVLNCNIAKTKLETLEGVDEPITELIKAWRKPSKAYSTYIKPIASGSPHIYAGGLAHPVISTTRVRTWRTASDAPNSQNFPKRNKYRIVRRCVARDGYKVCAFDYAGIQARNVAMESKDKTLVKHYWARYDIHNDWTEKLLRLWPKFYAEGISVVEKDKKLKSDYRNIVKNKFVFPSFFGAQPSSIAEGLGAPEGKIIRLHEEFWDEFPEVADWHKEVTSNYFKTGYATGLSGFKRRAPIGYNEIINAPIQADESLIVLGAMANLSEIEEWKYQPNMEIHDDLTFIWPARDVEKNAERVIKEMLRIEYDWINVPLQVEMSVGDNWCDLEKVGEFASDTWDRKTIKGNKP